MDYSQLSDFEINKRVSDVFWPDINKSPECNNKTFPQNSSVVYKDNGYGGFSRDYCNNPADSWPIIVNNQISLMYEEAIGKWCAGKPYWVDGCEWQLDIDVMEANPLRAAMMVFLMIQDKS